jgi:hypothetical protein
MTLQKFIEQGHAPWNIFHSRMNLAQVFLLLLDRGFEVDASHSKGKNWLCVGTERAFKFRQLNASRRVVLFLPSPRIIAR